MLKINQFKILVSDNSIEKLQAGHSIKLEYIKKCLARHLHLGDSDIHDIAILKESIDARKKPDISFVYSISFNLSKENQKKIQSKYKNDISIYEPVVYEFPYCQINSGASSRPVIVGSGPAGLLCAYHLAKAGLKPIIIERGQEADKRKEMIEAFWEGSPLNPECNVQFGEGGAGTFSDGKLQTGVKDKSGRIKNVLSLFIKCGADSCIDYAAKPHIGTDVLIEVIKNIRKEITELGGEYHFNTCYLYADIIDGKVKGLTVREDGQEKYISTDILILATGHSARDTYRSLYAQNIEMTSKPFAVGYRVLHKQELINESQYGKNYNKKLPSSDYKVTSTVKSGRGVYSFCMCPGGYVVNASSYDKMICVNGMSYSGRDSIYANSAIIITVDSSYFGSHLFDGLEFQEQLEKNAYNTGNGIIPVQSFIDFKNNIPSSKIAQDLCIKGQFKPSNVRNILPEDLNEDIVEAFDSFERMIKGFAGSETYLAGVETRTSAPVRITRDEGLESSVKGIFPCGEGAGYAGGIISAAVDGIKVAEKVAEWYNSH